MNIAGPPAASRAGDLRLFPATGRPVPAHHVHRANAAPGSIKPANECMEPMKGYGLLDGMKEGMV